MCSNKLVQVPKPAGFHTAGSTLDAYKLHLHQSQQVGSASMAAAVSPAVPSGKRSRKDADGEGSASSSSAAAGASGAAGSVYATPESVIAALKPFERAATAAGVKAALDAIDGALVAMTIATTCCCWCVVCDKRRRLRMAGERQASRDCRRRWQSGDQRPASHETSDRRNIISPSPPLALSLPQACASTLTAPCRCICFTASSASSSKRGTS
jgi:hypothetical protein